MKKYFSFTFLSRGQSLVEILLVMGLSAIIFPALMVGLISSRGGRAQQEQQLQATSQVEQVQEALRSIREGGWSAIATDGTYHTAINGSTWTLSPGAQTVNGYTQQVVIGDVYRNTAGTIVTTGGSLDPASKMITTTISWNTPYASSVQSIMYLTRYLNNFSHTDTTVSDFTPGTLTGTTITNTSGGEVELSGGGNADWCKPQNSLINVLTLPKQGNTISALPGAAYVGTGDGSQGVTFVNVSITDPAPPASAAATILGSYSSNYQTNAIFSDGKYVYLAAGGTSSQVIILDITHTPYTKVGWIDVPSGAAANGIYIVGNIAYVTSSNKLYTFDITTRTGDHTNPLTSVSMWIGLGSSPLAKQVVVVNGYAYVGTANTLFGLQKFRVNSTATNLVLVGVSNLTWQQASQGLSVKSDGSRAYIAFNNGAGFFSKGFFIVDTSPNDPPSWWPLPNFYSIIGTFNTGSTDPRGMAIPTSNRAIIIGNGGTQQYQVVDISNETKPTLCGGLAISAGVSGVASVVYSNNDAYSYIITGETKDQFKIIKGGIGGGSYATSGTFESASFDPGYQAEYNNFEATVSQPASTTIKMQVGVAAPIGGSCANASFTYLGPNNDPAQYFTPVGATISASIPFGTTNPNYQNPNRCYRYKAFLSTTDTSQTPILYDATTNYSP